MEDPNTHVNSLTKILNTHTHTRAHARTGSTSLMQRSMEKPHHERSEDMITRCHTVPVKAMTELIKKMHDSNEAAPAVEEERVSAASHKSKLGG